MFLGKKNLDLPIQFPAVGRGQTGIQGITAQEQVAPFGWERLVSDPVLAAFFEKSEHAVPNARRAPRLTAFFELGEQFVVGFVLLERGHECFHGFHRIQINHHPA